MNSKIPGYTIQETLFSNARTLIQRALRNKDGCPVIIKRFAIPYPNTYQRQHFLLSYQLLKKFEHPNITKALDYLEVDGVPVMVLEDSKAIDLHQYTQQKKQLPINEFFNIAIQLASVLSVIHHEQIIHKDLHPGNILINPESGVVQINDFGLASLLSREQPTLAPPEQLEGVLPYISPEQTGRMNRALDYRSDFYTLGVTFYELLSGEKPFSGDDALGIVHAHIAKEHKPLIECREDIPVTLSHIIDKLLHKMAEQRYQNALGLKKDLEKCRDMLATDHPHLVFKLGKDDISDRFQIPQTLYGRARQIETIKRCLQQAAEGHAQLLTVSGYSGVGKSALVNETHPFVAAYKGLFISGKFDQFQRHTPYSALKQALKSWLTYALSQSESDLQAMRLAINSKLGANARILIDFMPEFTPLLGELPRVSTLDTQETLNRFKFVFQCFIKLISEKSPLVLFLDDLQWADRGTLNLLPGLLDEEACRILCIVAYRDNEVDDSHPAIQTLTAINERETEQVTSVVLAPLALEHTLQLLVDSLHRPHQELQTLAELTQQKTGGNPFFINEFLKTLYNEALLNVDLIQHRWVWDVELIKQQGITDNVVELMLDKMRKLPEETQHIMQLAACVGSCFNFDMLSVISQRSTEHVMQQLWPAIKEGLVLQHDGEWLQEDQATRQGEESSSQTVSSHCSFLHDRMLEAAYSSLDESKKQATHLTIGRLLRCAMMCGERVCHDQSCDSSRGEAQLCKSEVDSAVLFAVVEQLNQSHPLITELREQTQLAALNLHAAQRAKSAGVWEVAANYALEGVNLLPDDAWQSQNILCSALYLLRIECEYLNGRVSLGNELADKAINQVSSAYDNASICYFKLSFNPLKQGVKQGLLGLDYCGLSMPKTDEITPLLIISEEALLAEYLHDIDLQKIGLNDVPHTPINIQLALRLIGRLAAGLNAAGLPLLQSYLIVRAMRLALEHHFSEQTIVIVAMYSTYMAKQKRYTEAKLFTEICIRLIDHYPQYKDIAGVYNTLGALSLFYFEPFSDALKMQNRSHELGLEYGDIQWGAVAGLSNGVMTQFVMGKPLETLSARLLRLQILRDKYTINIAAGSYYSRLVNALMQPYNANTLSEPLSKNTFSSSEWAFIQSCILKPFIEHLQLQWCFWSDQNELAWQSVKAAELSLELMSGFITPLDHRFLAALVACKKYPKALENERLELTTYIECSLDELNALTSRCAENFEHKWLLLRAEQSRALHHDMALVLAHYEQAIESARVGGYIQYQALANELCGHYWLAEGFDTAARTKLQQALYLYALWGCELKCSLLRKKHSRLLGEGKEEGVEPSERSAIITSETSSEYSRQGSSAMLATLSFESAMYVAQQISSELNLKTLFSRALYLIADMAGAESAAVVMSDANNLVVEALFTLGGDSKERTEGLLLDDCNDLPATVIRHVLNGEVVFNYFRGSGEVDQQAFNTDAYIKSRKPTSILCVPVSYRDEVIGVLYLDGHHLFTDDHLNILNMLLSQTVISFENARLFGKSAQLNKSLEQKVAARTLELEAANQGLQSANEELKSFSYSVSHDLRAPLRSIKGFSQVLMDEFSEGLDETGINLLQRIMASASKMSELINGLLALSKVQRTDVDLKPVNLSTLTQNIAAELNEANPEKQVSFTFAEHITVPGDEIMLYSAMENLLNNAWKYSSKVAEPRVAFGVELRENQTTYFIKDNGVGFDMAHAHNLFGAFQRLHLDTEFAGTGIGLATVKRIINKHAGHVWAEAGVDQGATFYFSLWSDIR